MPHIEMESDLINCSLNKVALVIGAGDATGGEILNDLLVVAISPV